MLIPMPMNAPTTRDDCVALDRADALAPLRAQFDLPPGVIYLDGNSLGVLPRATPVRLQQVVRDEWGRDLIRAWNSAGWIDGPQRVGARIGRLIGALPGEVIAADSTSLNLYKVLAVALARVRARGDAGRRVIVSERDNFPTDLYIAESLARQHGCTLRLVDDDTALAAQLHGPAGAEVAVLLLTHVHYRSGRMHPMAELTAAHGSASVTATAATSSTSGHGQRRPIDCSQVTTASISTVRCAGTPQPANTA